jgi:hypothetical protein
MTTILSCQAGRGPFRRGTVSTARPFPASGTPAHPLQDIRLGRGSAPGSGRRAPGTGHGLQPQPPGVRTVFQELFNPPAFASIQEEPPTSGELQTRVWLADWDARFWEWHCDAAEAAECQLLRISPRRTMGPCSYAAAAGRAPGTAGPRAALAARARLWAPTDGAQRGGARGAATKRRHARPSAFWVHAAPRQNSCSSATREANPAKILAVRASPSRW